MTFLTEEGEPEESEPEERTGNSMARHKDPLNLYVLHTVYVLSGVRPSTAFKPK